MSAWIALGVIVIAATCIALYVGRKALRGER